MAAQTQSGTLPRVLIVDLSLGYGGSTTRVLTLLEHSAPGSMGLACLEGASVTDHAIRMGLPVHIVGRNKSQPAILPAMIRIIRSEGYQVLDSQNIQAKWWASLAAALTGASLVSTIHSWYSDEHGASSLKGKLYTTLEMNTNGPLDRYISVSQQDVNRLLERGIPGGDIDLVYNAVDLSGLQIGGDGAWLRERFGLPADSIVAAAVGRLVWQKNHEMLINAMKKAVAEVPQLVAIIIGTGELKAELEDQIRSMQLEKNVLLAGYLDRNEVLKVVKSSDMYVMPSRYEGTPIALLEAAFLGRPILATYAGGIPELVSDPEHALLFQPDDSEGMAAGMVKIARDSGFARDLAERGQQHVREVFSLERQVQATWNAYQKAWAQHQSHHPHG